MTYNKIKDREKLMLLLSVTLVWLACLNHTFLPLFQQWNMEKSSRELECTPIECNESELESLQEEIKSLEEKVGRLSEIENIELSVTKLYLFLSDLTLNCGGEFIEIVMSSQEDQENSNVDLRFIWQGDYTELRNSLGYFKMIPWIRNQESILIRKISVSGVNSLQFEYQCQLIDKMNTDFQAKEPYIFEEEARDPFKAK